jgi:hypothetical protein
MVLFIMFDFYKPSFIITFSILIYTLIFFTPIYFRYYFYHLSDFLFLLPDRASPKEKGKFFLILRNLKPSDSFPSFAVDRSIFQNNVKYSE